MLLLSQVNFSCVAKDHRSQELYSLFTVKRESCAAFFSATSDEEMTMWVKGLTWLVADTLKSPTPLQIER